MKKYPAIKIKDGKKYFFRLDFDTRVQHIILAATVIILVLTGMPLKFSDTSWAPHLYSFFGGSQMAPLIHKWTGALMLILFVYLSVQVGLWWHVGICWTDPAVYAEPIPFGPQASSGEREPRLVLALSLCRHRCQSPSTVPFPRQER